MNDAEKVTVICIAYNHEKWISETLESVKQQDYYSKELIVIDNGSTDQTSERIKEWIDQRSGHLVVEFHSFKEPQPYCRLFNQFLNQTTSQYLIDLSGDDLLYPEHLSTSIKELRGAPFAAFVFSDAYLLDEKSQIRTFYPRNSAGELKEEIELSNIYETLIKRNFICSPTMVFNAPILRKEGGYDETLFYEDFDIQLRLARKYPVVFSDHMGVLKRLHGESMSSQQYKRYQSQMLPSTVRVCSKIKLMNLYPEENKALADRIQYELKHALWSANFDSARELVQMGEELGMKGFSFSLYRLWAKKAWDISWLYLRLT
ncbi:glycosyltransferase [Algoriphagus aquatilis]|uniref:Glycosyltransferase n=1 Tax=Algoriphagus aquatilis TaxID=490186 RepID=A0ABW0BY12_9BACT